MEKLEYILVVGVVGTSFLSASLGLAGGSALLFFLSLFFSMPQAIALHGLLQFIGGASRVSMFWRSLRFKPMVPYFVGLAGGTGLTYFYVLDIPSPVLKAMTGVALIAFALIPQKEMKESKTFSFGLLAAGGFLAGFFGPIIGVVGPITTPFFLKSGLLGEPLVVTKTFCHSLVHVSKMGVFWEVFVDFLRQKATLTMLMVGGTLLGTYFGSQWLKKLSNKKFLLYSRWLLGIIGVAFLLTYSQ